MLPTLCAAALAAAPVLPESRGPFQPAQLEVAGKGAVRVADLREEKTCAPCHADAVQQWRSSAHAFASFNNPLYRPSVMLLRFERGVKPSRMCAACHDPALLVDGLMDQKSIPVDDARAHAGVTCTTCHGVVATRPDGNGSFTLSTAPVPIPNPRDAASVARHRARLGSPALRTSQLCGSCHRAFLDATTGNASAFFSVDDFTPWLASGQAAGCRDCHMPLETATRDVSARDGRLPSHRFPGGHTYLAAMRGDREQVQRVQTMLVGAASVDVAPDATMTGPHVSFDVVIRNLRVGHRFPGGASDVQGTRLEVVVRDDAGKELARHDGHELRAEVVDAAGEPLRFRQTHHFAATAWDRTIPPAGVQVVRYRLEVPAGARVSVVARLLHRSRSAELAAEACKEAATIEAKRVIAATKKHNGVAIDPCVEQPVTEIATSMAPAAPSWERRLWHGVGLDDASVLGQALSDAPDEASKLRVRRALAQLRAAPEAPELGAVTAALALNPRDPRLLRLQADLLAAAGADAGAAAEAARRWRVRDCSEVRADCAEGQQRVREYRLEVVRP